MRKLAVVLLSLSVFTAQLSAFTVTAGPGVDVVDQKRFGAISKGDPRQENRPVLTNLSQPQPQLAVQELASVIAEAQSLQNKADAFKVLSKSANLLWLRSPTKSRSMFQQLWRLTNEQMGESDDREDARTDILRYLAPRDSKLAAKLLEEAAYATNPREVPFSQLVKGSDPTSQRLIHLASKLVQQEDSNQAARVLERALAVSVTPAALSTLTRLRQRSPELTDHLVTRTLDRLKTRPTVLSLPGLYLLLDYVFPASNVDANAATVNAPSQRLQVKYFSTSYNVLNRSLKEPIAILSKEQGYSKNDLLFRLMFQNQLAGVLAALAPKFAPELILELRTLATEQVTAPPNAAIMARFTRLRLSNNEESSGDRPTDIAIALAKGDIFAAERLLGGVEDEKFRKALAQTIARVAFDLHLAKSELDDALSQARKLENPEAKAIAFAQLARVARAKRDTELSKLVVAEALSFFSGRKSSGLQARALLMLAPEALDLSVDDSLDLLRHAVTVINDLPKVGTTEGSGSFDPYNLDDPLSLKEAPELQRAFSTIASQDFEGTLLVARQIEPKLIGLLARLAALDTVLKKIGNKTTLSATGKHHGGNSFELGRAFLQSGKRKPPFTSTINTENNLSLRPEQLANCSCSPCLVKTSLSSAPGPWWDCASDCLRTGGVSPAAIIICGATCAFGTIPICAVCFAVYATIFNFCALYCATHVDPPPPRPGFCVGKVNAAPEEASSEDPSPSLPVSACCDDLERYTCESGGGTWDDPNCQCISPIVIDVAGNGFNLTNASNGVLFDISGAGVPKQISWTSANSDDAWLALDRNRNGTIDDGGELFGSASPQPYLSEGEAKNGFRALAMFDRAEYGGRSDGQIDLRDAVFFKLKLWQDRNHNGVSEAGELQSLADSEVRVIELGYRESKRQDEHGNWFRYRAKVRDARGAQVGRWAWDVFLRTTKSGN